MKVPFVTIKNSILDFAQSIGLSHEEIDDKWLIKEAVDCVRWFHTDQQLRHRIAIIQIENSRGTLPSDYDTLAQAAAKPHVQKPCDCTVDPEQDCCKGHTKNLNTNVPCTRREDITQWVQTTLGGECKLEINVICPKCHKNKCNCNFPVVEIDVDRIWEMSHPEYYYKHFTKVGRFGNGPGNNHSFYTPEFELMRYATNNFFNVKNILTDCPNIDCSSCREEFMISLPYIEVSFQRGEVLLSYLGRMLDGDGEIMIPDHPSCHEAVNAHLRHKYFYQQGVKKQNQFFISLAQMAAQERDQHIAIARATLEIPSAQEWKSWLQNSSWLKRVPGWQSDYAGKSVPDRDQLHRKRLDGNTRK